MTVMVESGILLVFTCFILKLHFHGTQSGAGPVPGWARKLFLVYGAKLVCLQHIEEGTKQETVKQNGGHQTDQEAAPIIRVEPNNGNEEKKDGKELSLTNNPLINELRVITQHIRDTNEGDDLDNEWKLLANVLNRMCFVVFLCVFVVSTLVILLPAYHHHDHLDHQF